MKKLLQILIILIVLPSICFSQNNQTKIDIKITQTAVKAADAWLKLVDDKKYGESWEQAAKFFRKAVSKENWKQSLSGILPSYGKIISRELISATYKTSLPGAPDGEYFVITYMTSFEKKEDSFETVAPMKDEDGVWRVSGYFIK
ncbi:MAG: DUF4019 domain-containing protein [Thermodesulfobacteriota bacterium]|nr:DUF4019 domain-containing protein [Thermodesulfobacteriota bacterium]